MKNILPNLPKGGYLVDLQGFPAGNIIKKRSYLSYPSYLPFFVHFLGKKLVDKIAILSTSPDPCTKRNITEKGRKVGRITAKATSVISPYLKAKLLTTNDTKAG